MCLAKVLCPPFMIVATWLTMFVASSALVVDGVPSVLATAMLVVIMRGAYILAAACEAFVSPTWVTEISWS